MRTILNEECGECEMWRMRSVQNVQIKGLFEATTILHDEVHA